MRISTQLRTPMVALACLLLMAAHVLAGGDHGSSASSATPVPVPGTVAGRIDRAGDVDWFRFNARAGTTYGLRTVLGTLSDSVLHLYDRNGSTELAWDDDSGGNLASSIRYAVRTSGTYFVKVRHYRRTCLGTYRLQLSSSAPTPAPQRAPSAPTNLQLDPHGANAIYLLWEDNSTNETRFRIDCSTAGRPYYFFSSVGPNVTHFDAVNLLPNTRYCFRVRAENRAGQSAYSNEACDETRSPLPPPPPPSAPGSLQAVAISTSEVQLTWADSSTDETEFLIEARPSGGSYTQVGTAGQDVTTFTASNLAASTSYCFRVRTRNANGTSEYSTDACAQTQDPPAPSAQEVFLEIDKMTGASFPALSAIRPDGTPTSLGEIYAEGGIQFDVRQDQSDLTDLADPSFAELYALFQQNRNPQYAGDATKWGLYVLVARGTADGNLLGVMFDVAERSACAVFPENWPGMPDAQMVILLAHELGHAFNLHHTDWDGTGFYSGATVMSYSNYDTSLYSLGTRAVAHLQDPDRQYVQPGANQKPFGVVPARHCQRHQGSPNETYTCE